MPTIHQNFNWINQFKREFWRNPSRLIASKVVISMLFVTLPFVIMHESTIAFTIALGIVAAALAETDDHPKGRLKALIATILSFAITTISATLLKPYPIIFGAGFIASTIVFVIIGGISERYRGISYGAILIGIYAMIAYDDHHIWYAHPLYLCSGSLIYGLLSLFLLYRKPWRLLDEQLATGFIALSEYLEEKAKHFPISDPGDTNKEAILNIQVVGALERCKEVINIYSGEVKDVKSLLPYLQRFMLLQSLHERASSSHEPYQKLSKKIEYKELFEGFSELLHQLSHATRLVAESMLTNEKYEHPVSLGWIVNALEFEIEKMPVHDSQLLELLLHNLSRSHYSLAHFNSPEQSTSIPKLGQDTRSTWQKIKHQLNFSHPRLRYAIRLSSCFLIGYALVQYFQIEKGEWIMLTSLFVSQPTYSETRRKLMQRILGTLTGVATGVLLLQLLPTVPGRLIIIIASAYFFFYWLRRKYSTAAIFITIFVLAGNELRMLNSADILLPRIAYTIAGAMLAFLAIRFLWPNWQYKRIPHLLAEALHNNAFYFEQIIHAEHIHQTDDYTYRLARRLAHKSDNALTLSWQTMQIEPSKMRNLMQHAFTLTYLNHALLSHLSALGALQEDKSFFKSSLHIDQEIENALKETAARIHHKQTSMNRTSLKPILIELKDKINGLDAGKERQHLRLIYNIAAVSNKLLLESEKLYQNKS